MKYILIIVILLSAIGGTVFTQDEAEPLIVETEFSQGSFDFWRLEVTETSISLMRYFSPPAEFAIVNSISTTWNLRKYKIGEYLGLRTVLIGEDLDIERQAFVFEKVIIIATGEEGYFRFIQTVFYDQNCHIYVQRDIDELIMEDLGEAEDGCADISYSAVRED